jgi:membrane protein required for colicin V production
MTVLDYLVLLIVLVSLVAGAAKGVIKGALGAAFAIAALIGAARLYSPAATLFGWFTSSPRTAQLLGFIAVFLLILAGGMGLSWALRKTLQGARLSWLDHFVGAAFGLLRGWLICSALYLALTAFPLRPDAVTKAKMAPFLLEGTRTISYLTSDEMRRRFAEGYELVRGLWSHG